jgi:hypothetical protein
MAEESRNPGSAIKMASAFPLILHSVDPAPPFAEDAFVEDSIRNLALEIQETELRILKLLWGAFALFKLCSRFGELWAKVIMLLP